MKRTSALVAAACIVAAGAVTAGQASAQGNHVGIATSGHAVTPVVPAGATCADQMGDDAGTAIVSQKFLDEGYDVYDSRGAADFALKRTCSIASIDVAGQYFNGAGPAVAEKIVFYKDDGGMPGAPIYRKAVIGEDTTGLGSFHLVLPQPVTLDAGTYWVSVRANMAYTEGGEWGWELTSDQPLQPGMWHNLRGGFGVGCLTWQPLDGCVGYEGDFMFALNKTA